MVKTTVWFNGEIVTLVDGPAASLVVVEEGKIVVVGSGEGYKALVDEDAELRDLEGATLLPGFVESHNHFNAVANQWGWVDVGITQCTTTSQVLEKIKQAAEAQSLEAPLASGLLPWIKCSGFDDTLIEEHRNLTKEDIDSVCADLPVWVWHPSLHRVYTNSKALEIAGIDDSVENPEGGGIFVRNAEGKITGQMEEMAAYQKVYVHLNKTLDMSSKRGDMWSTATYFASRGVTSIHDLFVGPMLFNIYLNAFAVSCLLLPCSPTRLIGDEYRFIQLRTPSPSG